jgi:hypothetical protein
VYIDRIGKTSKGGVFAELEFAQGWTSVMYCI